MSENGGRHQRTFSGLVGALVVTVLAIVVFVAFRGLARDNVEVTPQPVEYLSAVRFAQEQGFAVAYPARLPDGWMARDVNVRPGAAPIWNLDLLTTETRFVGIHQEVGDVDDIVARLVDEQAVLGEPVTLPGASVEEWSTFTDEGGDYALVAELGGPVREGQAEEGPVKEGQVKDDRGHDGQVLIVYGTAGEQPIRDLAASLTFDDR